jgi:hypothetical protein
MYRFTIIKLSGDVPKRPKAISTLCLQLGPDFMRDQVKLCFFVTGITTHFLSCRNNIDVSHISLNFVCDFHVICYSFVHVVLQYHPVSSLICITYIRLITFQYHIHQESHREYRLLSKHRTMRDCA